MSVTKECRLCGRILEFNAGMRLQTCPACGSQNECPQMEGLTLDNFRQAIRLRNAREFDRAEKSYDLVLNADPDNAEALWGRVLCHYGAAPVFDGRKTYYMIHRPDDLTPLQEQADYKYACQLAPPELRAQIEIEGRYIDRAIQRIRELADTKPAYDVFLCHKCSRPEGGYTEDYKRANNLYMMLKEQGYRVFFAPVEMERRAAGEDYEAMIYHALRSSRVMLVVCSNREYLLSKWVQAEWQRYLRMMRDDPGKRLIPLLYGGLDVYRLPTEFRNWNLQCINMEGDGNALVLQNVQRIVGVRQNVRTNIDYADRQDEPPPPPPPRNHFGRMLTVLAVLAALVIGAAYFILNPPFCTHSSTSWQQVSVSYDRYSDELHWVTEENALFCDFCGKKLQTQTGDAYLEAHVFSGGACTKCDAKTTPTPEACQHPWSDVDWNDWQYAYYNEDEHQKWRTGEKRCGVCDAYLGPESEPVTREEHSYWGGKCRYCGVQVTPTPTATPRVPVVVSKGFEYEDYKIDIYSDRTCVIVDYLGSATRLSIPEIIAGYYVVGIGDFAFNCCVLKSVEIPSGVKSIGIGAFECNYSLTSVIMSHGVTSIGENAFAYCESLSSVILSDNLLSIGDFAFGLSAISSIVIPDSVVDIGVNPFACCDALTEIVVSRNHPALKVVDGVLFDKSGYRLICYPNGLSASSYTIPYGVRKIDDYAIFYCYGLKTVIISDSVTHIGDSVFCSCYALSRVDVPASVMEIDSGAFGLCDVTMYVTKGSYAERFAKENSVSYRYK